MADNDNSLFVAALVVGVCVVAIPLVVLTINRLDRPPQPVKPPEDVEPPHTPYREE
jgi:hypothetical protein